MIFKDRRFTSEELSAAKEVWNEALHTDGYTPENVTLKAVPIGGFGVFAKKDFKKREIVEMCPFFDVGEARSHTGLTQYLYWHNGRGVIVSGYGSMYNCSNQAKDKNIDYSIIPEQRLFIFFAVKDIKKGSELLTWWGHDYYYSWCKMPNSFIKIYLYIKRLTKRSIIKFNNYR